MTGKVTFKEESDTKKRKKSQTPMGNLTLYV